MLLAKLQKANMERASALTVFPAPAVPPFIIPQDPTQVEANLSRRKVIRKRRLTGAEIRIDPLPLPQSQSRLKPVKSTQEDEVILIAPWWPHNRCSHVFSICVWTTLASFHTAGTYCYNRGTCMSRTASRISCTAAQIATLLYYFFDTHRPVASNCQRLQVLLSMAAVVQAKTISDMIASMKLQRPRVIPFLPH